MELTHIQTAIIYKVATKLVLIKKIVLKSVSRKVVWNQVVYGTCSPLAVPKPFQYVAVI